MNSVQIISSSYPAHADDPTGTAGLFVRQFARELVGRGCRVVVQPVGRKARYEADPGLAIIPTPWLGGDRELASMSLGSPRNWPVFIHFLLSGIWTTLRLNRQYQVERVLCMWTVPSGLFGLAGKLLQGIPYDVWALGSDIWKIRNIPLLGPWLLRRIVRHADRVFADGRQLAREVEALAGVPCLFLPSSRTLPLPEQGGRQADDNCRRRLVFVGRYHPNKGPDLLLRAVALLPPALRESIRVELFGFGPLREELLRLTAELGLEAVLKVNGPLPAAAFAETVAGAEFLVIPSRIDSIPVVFSDALQLGTPVIAMPVGDLEEIVGKTGCGVVAAAVTAEALAVALEEALGRGRAAFRHGVAGAYAPLRPERAVETWLACHEH